MGVRLYSMIQIALIGHGLMAQVYARRCSAISGIEVVAVGADGLSDGIAPYVSGAYENTQELFEDAPDVVFVCSPPDSHRSVVKAAADRGIDVFCHPPIASTVEDASAIAAIVRRAGIVFVLGHVCRVSPAYATVKERIDGDTIGSVGNARAFRQLPTERRIASRDRTTDVVLGLAFHDIDFLRWVCGDIERVFAQRATHAGDAHALITLRFATAVGHIDARLSKRPDRSVRRFELAGEGLIEYDSEESSPVAHADDAADGDLFATTLPNDPHQLLIEHVLDRVEREQDVEPIVSIEDSIETLRVGLAALESMERGAPVALESVSES